MNDLEYRIELFYTIFKDLYKDERMRINGLQINILPQKDIDIDMMALLHASNRLYNDLSKENLCIVDFTYYLNELVMRHVILEHENNITFNIKKDNLFLMSITDAYCEACDRKTLEIECRLSFKENYDEDMFSLLSAVYLFFTMLSNENDRVDLINFTYYLNNLAVQYTLAEILNTQSEDES